MITIAQSLNFTMKQIKYENLSVGDCFVRMNNGNSVVVKILSISNDPEDPNRLLIIGEVFPTQEKITTRFKKSMLVVCVE